MEVGVRMDVASRSGWTIFHYASRSPAMLQLLLDTAGRAARPYPFPPGPRDQTAETDSGYDSETASLS